MKIPLKLKIYFYIDCVRIVFVLVLRQSPVQLSHQKLALELQDGEQRDGAFRGCDQNMRWSAAQHRVREN